MTGLDFRQPHCAITRASDHLAIVARHEACAEYISTMSRRDAVVVCTHRRIVRAAPNADAAVVRARDKPVTRGISRPLSQNHTNLSRRQVRLKVAEIVGTAQVSRDVAAWVRIPPVSQRAIRVPSNRVDTAAVPLQSLRDLQPAEERRRACPPVSAVAHARDCAVFQELGQVGRRAPPLPHEVQV